MYPIIKLITSTCHIDIVHLFVGIHYTFLLLIRDVQMLNLQQL